jgi:hypothetical protein
MIEKAKEERTSRADPEAQNFIEVFLDEIEKNSENPDTYFTGTLLYFSFLNAKTLAFTLTDQQLIVVLQDLFLGKKINRVGCYCH